MAFAEPLRNEICDAFCIEPLDLIRRETKEHPITRLALRKCLSDGFVGRMIIHFGEQDIKLDLDAPRSPRQIMQWWGTEYRRKQKPSYWISQATKRLSYYLNQGLASRIVLTDCRFANEAEMVRDVHAGTVWQVLRPGYGQQSDHASDITGAELQPELELHNEGDMRHLRDQVMAAYWAHDSGFKSLSVQIDD
jgi:hypothetical protein